MRIVKIDRETKGQYQDQEGNQYDLIEVPDGENLATEKEIFTDYDDAADYLTQNNCEEIKDEDS